MTEPEPCTTNGATRHQSIDLAPATDSVYITGRVGTSICGQRAYDETAARENFGLPIVLADLPACHRCGSSLHGGRPRISCPRCGKDCAMRTDGTPQRHARQLANGRRSMLICGETRRA